MRSEIEEIIRGCTQGLSIQGKCGEKILKPTIGSALSEAGFKVDAEDTALFLQAGLPVWRDKETGEVVPTLRRRRIDLVVRKDNQVVSLIETESDLRDLREEGISRRSRQYAVYSIARSGSGTWYHSYKSLERMAAAAFYEAGGDPTSLAQLCSDQ